MAFHLREALDADISALARLHVETFNETHRGGRPGGPSYELRNVSGVKHKRHWRVSWCLRLAGFADARRAMRHMMCDAGCRTPNWSRRAATGNLDFSERRWVQGPKQTSAEADVRRHAVEIGRERSVE
jgi:hypothetical protein